MRKKKSLDIVLILVFFVGLSVLLYPAISNYFNEKNQSRAIIDYEALVADLMPEDYDDLFLKAEEYNKSLEDLSFPFVQYKDLERNARVLDVSGRGMMGYVSIDKIKVQLPIYYGTQDSILNVAAGHLEGSSLPIGGMNTHSVVTAHRGLPSSKLFTNLDKLDRGDTFQITILNRLYTYEVEDIAIVKPDEVEKLRIVDGKDYVTLFTCTPYGINTHRLFVRGKRINNSAVKELLFIKPDAYMIDPILIVPFIATPILVAMMVTLIIKTSKQKQETL